MISGLVLNHLKGLGFVMNERYRPAAAGSRQVILTEPNDVLHDVTRTVFTNFGIAPMLDLNA